MNTVDIQDVRGKTGNKTARVVNIVCSRFGASKSWGELAEGRIG